MSNRHPKALVVDSYKDMLAHLASIRYRPQRGTLGEEIEVPVISSDATYTGAEAAAQMAARIELNAVESMPFIAHFPDDASREIFLNLHRNILINMASPNHSTYNTENWMINGELRSERDMLFAIQYLRIAGQKGMALESDLSWIFSNLGLPQQRSRVADKRTNASGPDGFFLHGGPALGLRTEAFAVEAKAGYRAASEVVTGIAATKYIAKGKGRQKERYRDYLSGFMPGLGRDDFGTVLLALIPTLDAPVTGIPADWKTYFDAALILNIWGEYNLF